jgi:hypothetical protein
MSARRTAQRPTYCFFHSDYFAGGCCLAVACADFSERTRRRHACGRKYKEDIDGNRLLDMAVDRWKLGHGGRPPEK